MYRDLDFCLLAPIIDRHEERIRGGITEWLVKLPSSSSRSSWLREKMPRHERMDETSGRLSFIHQITSFILLDSASRLRAPEYRQNCRVFWIALQGHAFMYWSMSSSCTTFLNVHYLRGVIFKDFLQSVVPIVKSKTGHTIQPRKLLPSLFKSNLP